MSEELLNRFPKCTSCSSLIMHDESSTKFNCPSCTESVIWRCEKCRLFVRSYTCPLCRYEAP